MTNLNLKCLDPVHLHVLADHETIYQRETATEKGRQDPGATGNHPF